MNTKEVDSAEFVKIGDKGNMEEYFATKLVVNDMPESYRPILGMCRITDTVCLKPHCTTCYFAQAKLLKELKDD